MGSSCASYANPTTQSFNYHETKKSFFCWGITSHLPFAQCAGTAGPAYNSTRLQLLAAPDIYFPEALAEDGRAGGYYRVSSTQMPFDVPVVWSSTGAAAQVPVHGLFRQGSVLGFDEGGTPLGILSRPAQYPGRAGVFDGEDFVTLPDQGDGGGALTGNAGMIGGTVFRVINGATTRHPAIWDKTGLRPVQGNFGPNDLVESINAGGTFLGTTYDTSNPSDYERGGFIGRDGTAVRLDFPGFTETRAFEINDDGWFTGVWEPAFATQRGYLARWDLDTGQREIYDLGLFPGYDETWAYAINNDRTIVGGAQPLGGDFDRALIWWRGSLVPQDLNLFVEIPGATLIDAYRINNAGQILAEARLHAGGYAYYVLTPVPEPAAAVGIAGLLLFRSWKRRRGAVEPFGT